MNQAYKEFKMEIIVVREAELAPFKSKIIEHFLHLSYDDMILRFFKTMNREQLSEFIESCIANIRCDSWFWLLIENQRVLGVGHLIIDANNESEIAISFNRQIRGRGLSTRIFDEMIQKSRDLGCSSVTVNCLCRNREMWSLLNHFGFTISTQGSEVISKLVLTGV